MINLQSNYPVLPGQDAEWARTLHEAVDLYGADAMRLPPFAGGEHNRSLAAGWLDVAPERVSIAEAGHHALLAVLLGAGLVGRAVAVEELTYPWFVRQLELLGCRPIPVAMDGEGMDPDALRAACTRDRIAAAYLMPSLHNPTGAVAPLARRKALVAVAREYDLQIVEDGAYGFLLDEEPARYTQLAPERAFYIESLSKRYAPGLRTAFLVSPPEQANDMLTALRVIASGASTLLASLGCSMAADGRLAATIAAKRREGALRLGRTRELLAGLNVEGDGNSWHAWVRLPEGCGSGEKVERACELRGVLVTGARWFTAPGVAVPRAVRLGLGGETEWARCAEGVRLFADVLSTPGTQV